MASEESDRLLLSLIEQHGTSVVHQHRWSDERERWLELVHAVATRCTRVDEHEVRAACGELASAGLLDTPAQLEEAALREAFLDVFQRHGFHGDESTRTVAALSDIARTLDSTYAGKIQVCLRACFEQMVETLAHTFETEALSHTEKQQALRYWLQNVAAAPISLKLERAQALCASHGVSWDDLASSADDADIPFPLLDDLVQAALAANASDSPRE